MLINFRLTLVNIAQMMTKILSELINIALILTNIWLILVKIRLEQVNIAPILINISARPRARSAFPRGGTVLIGPTLTDQGGQGKQACA